MRTQRGYIPVDTMFPHHGLNTTVPSTLLDPAFSPQCAEVTIQDGAIRKRTGYAPLGALTNVKTGNAIPGFYPMAVWWQGQESMTTWVVSRGVNVFIWDVAIHFTVGDWEAAHEEVETLRQAGHQVYVIRHPAYYLVPDKLDINFDLKWRNHLLAFNLDDEFEDKVPGGGGGNLALNPTVLVNYVAAKATEYRTYLPGVPLFANFNGTHVNGSLQTIYQNIVAAGPIDIICSDSYPCCNQQTNIHTSAKLYPDVVAEMVNAATLFRSWFGSGQKIWCFLECCNQLLNVAGTQGWTPDFTFDGSRFPSITELDNAQTALDALSGSSNGGIAWFPQARGGAIIDATEPTLVSTMVAISVAEQPTPVPSSQPTTDPVIGMIDFEDSTGVEHLVAITTTRRYQYDASVPEWVDITGSTAWTGTEDNRLSYVIAQGTDVTDFKVLIITNGKDKPQIWNGIDATFASVSWNYPNFTTCGVLQAMNGVLLMADITNSVSGRAPQNVAWTSFGKVNEWIDDVNGAGEQTLFDTIGTIIRLEPISGMMAVYAENSIHLMSYVGDPLIFTFAKVVESTRLVSGQAVANLGQYHVFMSQENFLLFDGTAKLPTVGDPIHQTYRTELDTGHRSRAFALLHRARRRVYFAVPLSATVTKFYLLDYDISDLSEWKWTPNTLYDRPLCLGFFSQDDVRQWNDPAVVSLPWANDAQNWSDASQSENFPLLVMGSLSGKVFLLNEKTFTDNGTVIDAVWQTKDFTVPQEYISEKARWIEIEFEAIGGMVDVSYYVDGGSAKVVAAAGLMLNPIWTRSKIYIDIVATSLRIEFSSADNSDFQLKWARPWLRPAGAR